MLRQGFLCIARQGRLVTSSLRQPVTTSYALYQTQIAGGLFNAAGKDSKQKDFVVKKEGKDDSLNTAAIDLPGLTEAGITIPTLETHESTVDGVRYDELPIVHCQSTLNNTILTITDYTGQTILVKHSCGKEGFKNVKKGTTVAAQATALTAGQMVLKKGVKNVRVAMKGLGNVRQAVLKGLQMSGLNIVSLSDKTPIHHDAPRPRKARRL